ncbi:hypothetical protein ACH79_32705 [Bradyrhizobium sp. CCBAU 051011]|nr:hypothetical protein ACH79_32705 [Bradyrhizobium sp. CCBAU 051011]
MLRGTITAIREIALSFRCLAAMLAGCLFGFNAGDRAPIVMKTRWMAGSTLAISSRFAPPEDFRC